MQWRWDQGRNKIFLFDNLQKEARVFANINGVSLAKRDPDLLRTPLEAATGLTFRPLTYKVWRNYARIFECAMLAANVDDRLVITKVCERLAGSADDRLDMDSYLSIVIPRFYYPHPAFEDYDHRAAQTFPFCSIIKLLLSRAPHVDASVGVEDVAAKIIGNHLTGLEPEQVYASLPESGFQLVGDRKRQVREMMMFLSQSSFLKWVNGRLFLDVIPGDVDSINALKYLSTPKLGTRLENASHEILRLGSEMPLDADRIVAVTRRQPADVIFTEGKRVRVTHLRTERSPYIREALFRSLPKPYLCDVCRRDMSSIYPWTDNILEVHHLLPLGSAVSVGTRGTSLSDVVPACPNCHRSVHVYLKRHLNRLNRSDFDNRNESIAAYEAAKSRVKL